MTRSDVCRIRLLWIEQKLKPEITFKVISFDTQGVNITIRGKSGKAVLVRFNNYDLDRIDDMQMVARMRLKHKEN